MFFLNMYESLYLTKLTTNYLTSFFYTTLVYDNINVQLLTLSIIYLFYLSILYFVYDTDEFKILNYSINFGTNINQYFTPKTCLTYLVIFILYQFNNIAFIFQHAIYGVVYYSTIMAILLMVVIFFFNFSTYTRTYYSHNKFYYLFDMYILFIEH